MFPGIREPGALAKVDVIEHQTKAEQAFSIATFLLKAKYKWLQMAMGEKDQAHVRRLNKISEFNETVKRVLAVIEYG